MGMRPLLFLAFAGACSFTGGMGTGDDVVDAPPTGDVGPGPEAGLPDAMVDVMPQPGDMDGDGVLDFTDNCPQAPNADQHDEDLDLTGDACDACPVTPFAADANADADDLPDACDPHVNTPGDRVEMLWTFAGPPAVGLPLGWKGVPATPENFVMANDELEITGLTTTQILAFNTTFENQGFEIGFTLNTYDPSGNSFVQALVDVETTAQRYFACGLKLDDNVRELLDFDVDRPTAMRFDLLDSAALGGVIGTSYRIGMLVGATTQTCAQVQPAPALVALDGVAAKRGNRHVGIRIARARITLRYAILYRY